jgi:hypothetical protein
VVFNAAAVLWHTRLGCRDLRGDLSAVSQGKARSVVANATREETKALFEVRA